MTSIQIANLIVFGIVGWLAFMIYIIPSMVAVFRDNPNRVAIIALNLLLGWTLLGWVGALVWALTVTSPRPAPTLPAEQ